MQNEIKTSATTSATTSAPVAPAAPAAPAAPVAASKPAASKPAATKPAANKPAPKAKRQAVKPSPVAAAPAPKADKAADRAILAKRISDERETANTLFAKLSAAISIPIKPLSAYAKSYKKTVTAHAIGRKPSVRQASALYIGLTANGGKLADKAKFARKFEINGAQYAIENGALSDAIASKLCTYNSGTETVTINKAADIQALIKTAGFTI